jgi:hypothetical protein
MRCNCLSVLPQAMNVRTDPTRYIGQNTDLTIFPLLSWYHASWDTEPDLPAGIII